MWGEKLRLILLTFFFVSLPISVALQQTALGLLLALLAYHGWRHAYARSSPLDWPVLTFFAALLLSALLSPAIRSSLVGLRKLWRSMDRTASECLAPRAARMRKTMWRRNSPASLSAPIMSIAARVSVMRLPPLP